MPENFSEQTGMFAPSLDGGQVAKEGQMTAERTEGYRRVGVGTGSGGSPYFPKI